MKRKTKQNKFVRQSKAALCALAAALAIYPLAQADPPPPHGVVAAHIGVEQLSPGNAAADVIVTNKLAVNDFRIRSSANRGDYDIQIGDNAADDVQGGIVITSIAEHTRDNGDSAQLIGTAPNQVPGYTAGPHVATSHIEAQPAGSYYIPIAYTLPNATSTAVIEFNMNIAAAWFPYDRYLGMFVLNSADANGGVNDTKLAGSSSLTIGTHFIDDNVAPLGDATVDLTSLGINANTDGVLLVMGAKNEDNYALSQVNANGTWTLFSKDNGTDGTSLERDPLAFVYIPKTDPNLIVGRFAGNGTILITSANTAGPDFTVAPIAGEPGRWLLTVTGGGPEKGVLIISPEGGQAINRDNIVTYQPTEAGDGWIIESRDLTHPTLPPLEDVGAEPVASFVYIPGSTPGFVVTPTSGLFTSEDATAATFTVALETRPRGDVTINVSSSNTAEGTALPSQLVFTAADWNIPQTITVTGVDDAATDGAVTYTIVLETSVSADTEYNNLNPADVTVVNIDNEGGITVNPTGGLTTTEIGGAATFTVRLTQAPTADVTIGLSSSDTTEGDVNPTQVVFTAENWNVDQTITITGVDDFVDDGDLAYTIVTAPAVSADPFFNQRNAANVTVTNTDDDTAGIVVAPIGGHRIVESSGQAIYTILLRSEPTADVVITTQTGDATEGTVTPATLTFNASNWSLEQYVTVLPVDDQELDGNVLFTINNSLTSTDPLYAAIDPADVTVTTLDDEASIVITGAANWGIGMPAVSIAPRASIIDPNSPDYAGATLRVSLAPTSGDDRLEIRNIGVGPGQIGVSGNIVTYEGMQIGTFSGGDGANPLVISLNLAATPANTQALLRAITYRDAGATPTPGSRAVTVTLTDAGGAVATAATAVEIGLLRVTEFQEGADLGYGSYTGAADIELHEGLPDNPFPTGRNNNGLYVDVNTANDGQVLLRFGNLVGDAPNQIPADSIVVAAELHLDINEGGAGAFFHRMLVPWDENGATWNSMGGGVQLDDVSARSVTESQIGGGTGQGATGTGNVSVGVTPDVQAWVSGGSAPGAANYGWVFISMPSATPNSTSFSPSEAANIGDRPRLRVYWLPRDSTSEASFRQNVNNYAGAADTRIVETAANRDTDYSTLARTFVDAVVSGTEPNQAQILIRFDDIFGSGPGQIPPGSRIEAAALDLASLGNDAPGDGGLVFPILQAWPEVNTWNGWVDGIQTNGVEAATTPTYTFGSPTLSPDAQGGFFSFLLTEDVQAWSSGGVNAGWAIFPWPGGGNGWAIALSEAANENERPRLRVYYSQGTPPTEIRLQQPVYSAGSVQLNFTGAPNTTYRVRRAATVDGTYGDIGPATTNAQGAGTFTDPAPPTDQAFYVISTQ